MKRETENIQCSCSAVHPEVIDKAKKAMPEDNQVFELAAFFKLCGEPTRMKILYALFATEMCVCDISELLGMTMSAVSHQLRILKQARMVNARKAGQNVFYSAVDVHVKKIIDQGMKHITE